MNITLKERLDLQRTARIITESQYNKLLKENEEMTPEQATAKVMAAVPARYERYSFKICF